MTSASTSNWLDRLRLSRGFPTGHEPGLDRFLSSSSSGSTAASNNSTHSPQQPPPSTRRRPNSGELSNLLCELFYMGESPSRSFSKKKCCRKQQNPRFFGGTENDLCSSDDLKRDDKISGSSGDNSLSEMNKCKRLKLDEKRDEFDDDDDDVDLRGFSRSEVVVLDTSLNGWKFDGWVFRKNDEWKVKERKIKSRVFGGKKNKKLVLSFLNSKDDGDKLDKDDICMKKKKKKNQDFECFLPLSKGQPQNNDRKEEPQPSKETADFQGKVTQKRFPCPRPPDKLRKEGSSVILLKSIPLNGSNVAAKMGKNAHKKCPKKMKLI